MIALFLICAAVVVYVYFGYPALIFVLAKLRPRPVQRAEITPSLSLIVPVFNEERVIEQKIRNSLDCDYPPDRLEMIVVSDGSTDATNDIVRRHCDPSSGLRLPASTLAPLAGRGWPEAPGEGLRFLELPRGGKAAALNAGAAAARGEILVLTDANVELHRDALRVLARAFADPGVGGVSGKKKYVIRSGTDTTEVGENLYWRYEQWQKELESAFGSIYAADGALYALRRELYVPIADPAQADDIAISARVVLQGKRLILDPQAIAYEEPPVEGAEEFRRKIRVTNHSLRALFHLGAALWTSGFFSVELISHKLLRHLVPLFLVLVLLSNLLLARRPLFAVALAAQVAFYALAAAGALLRHRRAGALKLFSVPYYFCLVNAAALLGVLSILRGHRVRAWSPRGT